MSCLGAIYISSDRPTGHVPLNMTSPITTLNRIYRLTSITDWRQHSMLIKLPPNEGFIVIVVSGMQLKTAYRRNVNHILHRDRFWAISIASGSVRLWDPDPLYGAQSCDAGTFLWYPPVHWRESWQDPQDGSWLVWSIDWWIYQQCQITESTLCQEIYRNVDLPPQPHLAFSVVSVVQLLLASSGFSASLQTFY